jgi:hypothetical protein
MPSFPDRINQLIRLISASESAVNARQGDRVFNFHYLPSEWTEFRKQLPLIKNLLKEQGFTPHVVSFGEICLEIFKNDSMYDLLVMQEGMASVSHGTRNTELHQILAGAERGAELSTSSPIVVALVNAIEETAKQKNGVLLLIDTETIHPLFRVSAFEQILQGKFKAPTIICYPGQKGTIGENPSFLGFYKSDGNYRSTHIY